MPTVSHDAEHHRFDITVDDEVVGHTAYTPSGGRRSFTHTEVDRRFEGQGLGATLIRAALDDTRAAGLQVLPFCPFVRAFIGEHGDYLDLVPGDQRARFDLEETPPQA